MAASVSLTLFLDYLTAQSTSKVTTVRKAVTAASTEYDPATDYWWRLREGIKRTHRAARPKSSLDAIMNEASASRANNYAHHIAEYKRWWGRKIITWNGISSRSWTQNGVTITINPELGLRINDTPWVVKLSFRAEGVPARRADAALYLLQEHYGRRGIQVGLLDVSKGKMLTPGVPNPDLPLLLSAETAGFSRIWDELGGP